MRDGNMRRRSERRNNGTFVESDSDVRSGTAEEGPFFESHSMTGDHWQLYLAVLLPSRTRLE